MCCNSLTHAANIKFQPNACSSCFKQNFPFCLEGRINIITLLNPLPVLIILLNPLPVLVALKIVREKLSFTCSFMTNTCPLVGCRKLRPKSKTIPCLPRIASSCLLYCSSIEWYLVLQRDSRFVSRNCHAAHRSNRTAWFEWF